MTTIWPETPNRDQYALENHEKTHKYPEMDGKMTKTDLKQLENHEKNDQIS